MHDLLKSSVHATEWFFNYPLEDGRWGRRRSDLWHVPTALVGKVAGPS